MSSPSRVPKDTIAVGSRLLVSPPLPRPLVREERKAGHRLEEEVRRVQVGRGEKGVTPGGW